MNQGLKGNNRREGVTSASGSNYWKNPWNPSVLRPFNSLIRDIYIIFRERLLTIKKSINFVGGQHRALLTEPTNRTANATSTTSTSRQFVTDNDGNQTALSNANSNGGHLPNTVSGSSSPVTSHIRCKSPLSSSEDDDTENEEDSDELLDDNVTDLDISEDRKPALRQSTTPPRHGNPSRRMRRARNRLPPGLRNNGNLCFLNSTLQALASIPSFVATLNQVVNSGGNKQSSVSAALSSVLQSLNGEEKLDIDSLSMSPPLVAETPPLVQAVDPSMLADLIRRHQLLTRERDNVSVGSTLPWSSSNSSSMLGSGSMLQEQQDAQELLQALIQALTEESSNEKSSDKSLRKTPTLKDMLDFGNPSQSLSSSMTLSSTQSTTASVAGVLGGWFGTSIECGSCGYKRPIANSPFMSMTLSLSDRVEPCVSIESCIEALTAPEWLRGVECSQCTIRQQISELEGRVSWLKDTLSLTRMMEDKEEEDELKQELVTTQSALSVLQGPIGESGCLCGQKCSSEADCLVTPVRSSICKRLLISRLPAVLILHVNRQEFCPHSGSPIKSRKRVAFGLELDMASYLSFGGADWRAVSSRSSPETPPQLIKSKSSQKNRMMYDLCAVIEHHGGARGGHYTTFRKVKQLPEDGSKETRFSWVHASDLQVEATTESRVLGCEAYLLFYERRSQVS